MDLPKISPILEIFLSFSRGYKAVHSNSPENHDGSSLCIIEFSIAHWKFSISFQLVHLLFLNNFLRSIDNLSSGELRRYSTDNLSCQPKILAGVKVADSWMVAIRNKEIHSSKLVRFSSMTTRWWFSLVVCWGWRSNQFVLIFLMPGRWHFGLDLSEPRKVLQNALYKGQWELEKQFELLGLGYYFCHLL